MRRYFFRAILVTALLVGVAYAGAYPPGLSFATVLNGVKILSKDAKLRLYHIQAVFLPDGATGHAIVKKADGTKIYRFEWKSQKLKAPYFLMDFWKCTDLRSNENLGSGWVKLFEPGNYIVDFYLQDKKFYTFPFSVSKISGPDPFAGGDYYYTDGAWSDWGYLYYRDANPEMNIQWKVWLRHQLSDKIHKSVSVRVEVTRDKGKKLICTSREHTTQSLSREWTRYAFDLVNPPVKTSGGSYFKAKDLLAVDGSYTLKVKIDEVPYGTWKFSIKGGKLQPAGRTVRGKADPLTFVEGGRDAFWYKKL